MSRTESSTLAPISTSMAGEEGQATLSWAEESHASKQGKGNIALQARPLLGECVYISFGLTYPILPSSSCSQNFQQMQ